MRLKAIKCFVFSGNMTYHVIYDTAAGSPNRFTVTVRCSSDPLVIGRELPLKECRALILDYEKVSEGYLGSRKELDSIHQKVVEARKHTIC